MDCLFGIGGLSGLMSGGSVSADRVSWFPRTYLASRRLPLREWLVVGAMVIMCMAICTLGKVTGLVETFFTSDLH